MDNIKTSLLISTYNWPEALDLVFRSVLAQSVLPHEIIIADDGSTDETNELIKQYQSIFHIPVKHFWQEDKGFRKTIILNHSIRNCTGDYIIQIDGDIILNRHFIKDHLNNFRQGYFVKGSRSMISSQKTKEILRTKNININSLTKGIKSKINGTRWPLLSPLFYGDSRKTNDLRGCNFAFWKKDFISVNGYNNDLQGWGHEDIELAARLVNNGVKRRQLKLVAVCYHLYHRLYPRDHENYNFEVYKKTVEKKIKKCKNGYQ